MADEVLPEAVRREEVAVRRGAGVRVRAQQFTDRAIAATRALLRTRTTLHKVVSKAFRKDERLRRLATHRCFEGLRNDGRRRVESSREVAVEAVAPRSGPGSIAAYLKSLEAGLTTAPRSTAVTVGQYSPVPGTKCQRASNATTATCMGGRLP